MPPYAGATHELALVNEEETQEFLNPLTSVKSEFFDNYMSTLCVVEEPKATKFDKVLNFHPCAIRVKNPSSALFKIRICAESGEEVHKYRKGGYTKEKVVGENGCVTKRYLSPFGVQRRQDRLAHNDAGYAAVMNDLLEHFRAIEQRAIEKREEQRANEQKVERQAKKIQTAQKAAEDKRASKDAKLQNRAKKAFRNAWNKTKTPFSKRKKVGDDQGTWKSTVDPRLNSTYYYHTKTRQTTWIKPKGFVE